MNREARHKLLLATASITILVALLAGMYHREALLAALPGLLVWAKKLLTLSGLLSTLKKLPLVALVGGKKLFLKLASGLLLYSARTRFRIVRLSFIRLKLVVRRAARLLRYHWNDMDLGEKALLIVVLVPLTLALMAVLTLLAAFPRALRSFAVARLQESTAATVIDRAIPVAVKARAGLVHRAVRHRIRGHLQPVREVIGAAGVGVTAGEGIDLATGIGLPRRAPARVRSPRGGAGRGAARCSLPGRRSRG